MVGNCLENQATESRLPATESPTRLASWFQAQVSRSAAATFGFSASGPQTIMAREKRGLIERLPRKARSIRLRVARFELPELEQSLANNNAV